MNIRTENLEPSNKYWSTPAARALPATLPDYGELSPKIDSDYGVCDSDHGVCKTIVGETYDGVEETQRIYVSVDWSSETGWFATVRVYSLGTPMRGAFDYHMEDLCIVKQTQREYEASEQSREQNMRFVYEKLCEVWPRAYKNIR